ncbi:MAG: hypothetical protein JRJ79_16010 [Deltaproteobacteria bacterium]|jgi:hypothetical protein|nr:hypothetical protein [Deltaproteobacteria bacterium]MBW1796246.1 hypothetical protein [Deltaproteobacteria bacterium]
MPVTDKHDAETIRLIRLEAEKFEAKVRQIDLEKQVLDIDCPDESKVECAIAIQKILDRHSKD